MSIGVDWRFNFPSFMKDIPTEDLAAISAEIHEAAARVGCTHVSITGHIWPGGHVSGPLGKAARFVEFSWLKAAVIDGRAIFEETDPAAYANLLIAYGLAEEADPTPAAGTPSAESAAPGDLPTPVAKIQLTIEVLPATRLELERQAKAGGLSVGEFLDWKFQTRGPDAP